MSAPTPRLKEAPAHQAVDTPSTEPAIGSNFPASPSQFDEDDRVSYSQQDRRYILEADDGTEYEWNGTLKRWVVSVDHELLSKQQEAYKIEGVDENTDAIANIKQQKEMKKRKLRDEEKTTKQKKPRVNTAVYVTSLPSDATVDEISGIFSRCGMIAEELETKKPRIKMYEDENGIFKGEALIVYFRPESVDLAIQLLDETKLRLGDRQTGKMKVQPADFSFKAHQEDAPANRMNQADKKKLLKKKEKMNNKLADWDDDDPSVAQKGSSRWDKVVVLKHMFSLQEIEEEPAAILDIKEDIREECSKLGEVSNVTLFDLEPDGVVSVKFSDTDAAAACVRMMDGRFFAGTRVEAKTAEGNERFRKTNPKKAALEEELGDKNENDEEKRLEKFGSWLEGESKSESKKQDQDQDQDQDHDPDQDNEQQA